MNQLRKSQERMMEGFILLETQIIIILIVISLVAVVAKYLRMPYTVALVVVGLALTLQNEIREIELTPNLVLALFLPPLVFEAAFHLQFRELRDDLAPILTYAIPGVLMNTLSLEPSV